MGHVIVSHTQKVQYLGVCADGAEVVRQERMEDARNLFRNAETTEFVIVTIPTVMAVAESARLAKALRVEGVPVNTIVINQVIPVRVVPRRARGSRTHVLDRSVHSSLSFGVTIYNEILARSFSWSSTRWCTFVRVSRELGSMWCIFSCSRHRTSPVVGQHRLLSVSVPL